MNSLLHLHGDTCSHVSPPVKCVKSSLDMSDYQLVINTPDEQPSICLLSRVFRLKLPASPSLLVFVTSSIHSNWEVVVRDGTLPRGGGMQDAP